MKDLEHPALIKECIQNLHTAAYEKNLHKDANLPSMKKKIDRNYKTECWPKIIMEGLNLLPIIGIPALLLNLVYYHGFMMKLNSTILLNFRSRLINNYSSKGLFII